MIHEWILPVNITSELEPLNVVWLSPIYLIAISVQGLQNQTVHDIYMQLLGGADICGR